MSSAVAGGNGGRGVGENIPESHVDAAHDQPASASGAKGQAQDADDVEMEMGVSPAGELKLHPAAGSGPELESELAPQADGIQVDDTAVEIKGTGDGGEDGIPTVKRTIDDASKLCSTSVDHSSKTANTTHDIRSPIRVIVPGIAANAN
jgi:hypothetical protein